MQNRPDDDRIKDSALAYPVRRHRCEQCFACLQCCPVEAIEWGWRTQGKPRYHHPEYRAHHFLLNYDNSDDS